jgi:hypothetical protein
MTMWAQGFWADGFWAEGFWEGLTAAGGGDSTYWRSPPKRARKRKRGTKDNRPDVAAAIAGPAPELPEDEKRPLPDEITALLDAVAPQARRDTPAAAPQLDAKRRDKARNPGTAEIIAEPIAVEPPIMVVAEDPAVTAERQRRERLYQIALADDEWLMTVI